MRSFKAHDECIFEPRPFSQILHKRLVMTNTASNAVSTDKILAAFSYARVTEKLSHVLHNGQNKVSKKTLAYIDNHPSRQGNMDLKKGAQERPENVVSLNRRSELSRYVLSTCETTDSGEAVGMESLKEQARQFLTDHKGRRDQKEWINYVKEQAVQKMVNKIFTLVQRYAAEFNEVAQGTELFVSCSHLGQITEVIKYNRFREAEEVSTYFRARISTTRFSLILRGDLEGIQIFVVPSNQSIAGSLSENQYAANTEMKVDIDEEGMSWQIKGRYAHLQSNEKLAMALLRQLIHDTQRDMKHREN